MSADIIDEVSGVFDATLNEDMMETVRRVKRPFIDCKIPDFFDESQADYPLVYVPSYLMTFPLHKGDKVKVYFNQKCLRYPVLWKIPTEYCSDFTKELSFPASGALVKFPSAEKVIAVQQLNDNTFIYSTDKYALVRTGDQFTLITPDGTVSNYKDISVMVETINLEVKSTVKTKIDSSVDIQTSSSFSLKASNDIDIKSTGGKLFFGNGVYDLAKAISDLCTILLTTPSTIGSPAVQSFNPTILQAAAQVKAKAANVFK